MNCNHQIPLHWIRCKTFNFSSELWPLQGISWWICLLPPLHTHGHFSRLDLEGGEARACEWALCANRYAQVPLHKNPFKLHSHQQHVGILFPHISVNTIVSPAHVCQSNRWERVPCFNMFSPHSYWAEHFSCLLVICNFSLTNCVFISFAWISTSCLSYLFHITIWRGWHILSVILCFVWCECFFQVCE